MEYRMQYKAFVLKERQPNCKPVFCHIGFNGSVPEFIYSSKPNLLPDIKTMAAFAAHYKDIGSALFHEIFDAKHELVDCELIIKDSTALTADAPQSGI